MATFEEEMDELEQVVGRLEQGGLPLEESVGLFERGMHLTKSCKARLSSAESRIQAVLDPEDSGPLRTIQLPVPTDDELDEDDAEERFDDDLDED